MSQAVPSVGTQSQQPTQSQQSTQRTQPKIWALAGGFMTVISHGKKRKTDAHMSLQLEFTFQNDPSVQKVGKYFLYILGPVSKKYSIFCTILQTTRLIYFLLSFVKRLNKNTIAVKTKIHRKNCWEIGYCGKSLRIFIFHFSHKMF